VHSRGDVIQVKVLGIMALIDEGTGSDSVFYFNMPISVGNIMKHENIIVVCYLTLSKCSWA